MDKDLEKILNKAKSGEPKPKEEVPVKIFPKNGPYDYLVFTKLVRFSGFSKLIFLIVLPALISIGLFYDELRLYVIYVLVIYGCLLTIFQITNFIRYQYKFKGWQERLPFELKGWNEMIHTKKMFCDLCWNHTRVEVVTTDSSHEILELVQAALTIFSKKTKRAYYSQDLGRTTKTVYRNDWKINSSVIAEGSANPEVMRYMKNLFQNELTTIAKKTGKIKLVNVTLLSDEFEVGIVIYNGD